MALYHTNFFPSNFNSQGDWHEFKRVERKRGGVYRAIPFVRVIAAVIVGVTGPAGVDTQSVSALKHAPAGGASWDGRTDERVPGRTSSRTYTLSSADLQRVRTQTGVGLSWNSRTDPLTLLTGRARALTLLRLAAVDLNTTYRGKYIKQNIIERLNTHKPNTPDLETYTHIDLMWGWTSCPVD